VDLTGVFFASCSSGKGLRAYPGVAMVFYNHEITPAPDKLPRYLDLGFCAQQQGIPFTFSSNLLHALHAAVRRPNLEKRFAEIAGLSAGLRQHLAEMGFDLIGNGAQTSPAVITIALPPELNSLKIGEAMQEAGYLLSYNSDYLRRKNWIQICMMGECPREKVVPVANALNRVCFHRAASPAVTV
jgi:aspartate aminotransferase-like enzyme